MKFVDDDDDDDDDIIRSPEPIRRHEVSV